MDADMMQIFGGLECSGNQQFEMGPLNDVERQLGMQLDREVHVEINQTSLQPQQTLEFPIVAASESNGYQIIVEKAASHPPQQIFQSANDDFTSLKMAIESKDRELQEVRMHFSEKTKKLQEAMDIIAQHTRMVSVYEEMHKQDKELHQKNAAIIAAKDEKIASLESQQSCLPIVSKRKGSDRRLMRTLVTLAEKLKDNGLLTVHYSKKLADWRNEVFDEDGNSVRGQSENSEVESARAVDELSTMDSAPEESMGAIQDIEQPIVQETNAPLVLVDSAAPPAPEDIPPSVEASAALPIEEEATSLDLNDAAASVSKEATGCSPAEDYEASTSERVTDPLVPKDVLPVMEVDELIKDNPTKEKPTVENEPEEIDGLSTSTDFLDVASTQQEDSVKEIEPTSVQAVENLSFVTDGNSTIQAMKELEEGELDSSYAELETSDCFGAKNDIEKELKAMFYESDSSADEANLVINESIIYQNRSTESAMEEERDKDVREEGVDGPSEEVHLEELCSNTVESEKVNLEAKPSETVLPTADEPSAALQKEGIKLPEPAVDAAVEEVPMKVATEVGNGTSNQRSLRRSVRVIAKVTNTVEEEKVGHHGKRTFKNTGEAKAMSKAIVAVDEEMIGNDDKRNVENSGEDLATAKDVGLAEENEDKKAAESGGEGEAKPEEESCQQGAEPLPIKKATKGRSRRGRPFLTKKRGGSKKQKKLPIVESAQEEGLDAADATKEVAQESASLIENDAGMVVVPDQETPAEKEIEEMPLENEKDDKEDEGMIGGLTLSDSDEVKQPEEDKVDEDAETQQQLETPEKKQDKKRKRRSSPIKMIKSPKRKRSSLQYPGNVVGTWMYSPSMKGSPLSLLKSSLPSTSQPMLIYAVPYDHAKNLNLNPTPLKRVNWADLQEPSEAEGQNLLQEEKQGTPSKKELFGSDNSPSEDEAIPTPKKKKVKSPPKVSKLNKLKVKFAKLNPVLQPKHT